MQFIGCVCGVVWCTCRVPKCPNCGARAPRPKKVADSSVRRLPWIAAQRERDGAPPLVD